jgi:hypothetical protein
MLSLDTNRASEQHAGTTLHWRALVVLRRTSGPICAA